MLEDSDDNSHYDLLGLEGTSCPRVRVPAIIEDMRPGLGTTMSGRLTTA